MSIEKFPIRLGNLSGIFTITLPRPMEANAKIYLRNMAKGIRLYHTKIETGISGRANDGSEIPIDTIGKWLFGTPGYMGHIRVSNWDGCQCTINYPKDAPKSILQFLLELKTKVEQDK